MDTTMKALFEEEEMAGETRITEERNMLLDAVKLIGKRDFSEVLRAIRRAMAFCERVEKE